VIEDVITILIYLHKEIHSGRTNY